MVVESGKDVAPLIRIEIESGKSVIK